MPYFEIEGANVYKELKEPKFHLLTFFDGENEFGEILKDEMIDFHDLLLYPHIAEIFGAARSIVVLLRPIITSD